MSTTTRRSARQPAKAPVAANEAAAEAPDPLGALGALGARIQRGRADRQMTLEVLAERSGLSKGYLSRVENGLQTPPLGTLIRIAGALGIDVTSLINGASPPAASTAPVVSVVRKNERSQVIRGASAFGYDYASLIRTNVSAKMEAFLFSFPSNIDKYVFFEHDGEEFLFMLSGRVEWQIGHERHVLEPGDAVYFDARLPHRGRALDGDASALVVSHRPDA